VIGEVTRDSAATTHREFDCPLPAERRRSGSDRTGQSMFGLI
jgi:hypothetical protein